MNLTASECLALADLLACLSHAADFGSPLGRERYRWEFRLRHGADRGEVARERLARLSEPERKLIAMVRECGDTRADR